MKRKLLLLSLLSLGLIGAGTVLAVKTTPARNTQVASTSAPPPPEASVLVKLPDVPIERQALKASQLFEGMSKAEVLKIMGQPANSKVFPNGNAQIEILNYPEEPLVTKVSLIDGSVSGVTAIFKTITPQKLPEFARAISVGMSRSKLLKLMGKPLARQENYISQYHIEQFTFSKKGELPVNVVLQDGRVEGINTGLENPGKVTKAIFPAEVKLSAKAKPNEQIRIGMSPKQVVGIFGKPGSVEFSEVEGQRVAHIVYSALNTNASTQFTFVNNVLTRFSFVPQSNFIGKS